MSVLNRIVSEFQSYYKNIPATTVISGDVLKLERELAYQNTECNFNKISERVVTGSDIKKAITDGFSDVNILKGVLCLNNSILTVPSQMDRNTRHKIKEYITDLTKVGGRSVYGYAMLSEVQKKSKDVFIVKVPRNISEKDTANQLHEYVVAVYGTNDLRKEIPNFSFVLGRFSCSPPYIDNVSYLGDKSPDKSKAITYCQSSNEKTQTEYIIYEPIFPSVTLSKFITGGASEEDFLNVMVQILFALDIAEKKIMFTHNDLHTENVLVKTLKSPIEIEYKLSNGKTYYLKTKLVASIIDFGQSYIEYDKKKLGFQSLHKAGILADRSHHSADIMKVLLFSAVDSFKGFRKGSLLGDLNDKQISSHLNNSVVFNSIKTIMKNTYFTHISDDFGRYVNSLEQFYFSPPLSYDKKFKSAASFFETGINNKFKVLDNFLFTKAQGELYGCSKIGTCKTVEQVYTDYSTPLKSIESPYEFYERLESGKNLDVLNKIGRDKFKIFMDKLIKDNNVIKKDIVSAKKNTDVSISLKSSYKTNSTRYSVQNLERYKKYFINMVSLTNSFDDNSYIMRVAKKLINVYPELAEEKVSSKISYRDSVDKMSVKLPKQYLDKYRKLKEDIFYVLDIINQNKSSVIIMTYPQSIWVFDNVPMVRYAITIKDYMFE